jgi:hypothetical protein
MPPITARRASLTIPATARISVMIHRIAVTPPPQDFAARTSSTPTPFLRSSYPQWAFACFAGDCGTSGEPDGGDLLTVPLPQHADQNRPECPILLTVGKERTEFRCGQRLRSSAAGGLDPITE